MPSGSNCNNVWHVYRHRTVQKPEYGTEFFSQLQAQRRIDECGESAKEIAKIRIETDLCSQYLCCGLRIRFLILFLLGLGIILQCDIHRQRLLECDRTVWKRNLDSVVVESTLDGRHDLIS